MIHHRKLIAVLVSVACTTVAAETIDKRFAKYDVCGSVKIVHINGIITNPTAAALNLTTLATKYGNAYSGHLLTYTLAYNKTRGFPTDFYESVLQVLTDYAGATWSTFYNAVQNGIYAIGMPDATADAIAQRVDDLYGLTKPSTYQDQDLADIKAAVLAAVPTYSRGTMRMVFVPHSQGNLYAPLVYNELIKAGIPGASMGFVGVAVPAPSGL